MAKRTRIGIYYSYDDNWIGGTYYYQNLIKSLNLLRNEDKPHIVIIAKEDESFKSIKEINYPYLSYKNINKTSLLNKISSTLKRKILSKNKTIKTINFGVDVFFHPSEIQIPNSIKKHLYWIPDFQEAYFPELFSKDYIEFRKKSQQELLNKDCHVLFSSNDALNDFKELYPDAQTNCYVVNFSVFHPDYSNVKMDDLREKYNIETNNYFFCPNQFWKHKNHTIILKALKKIVTPNNLKFKILFSGKEFDYRNPTYFSELSQYVKDNNLSDYVSFLGFIDRKDQLSLMKNALAIIQPSLFEGWSTVVEDSKAMNQNIIVSSLNVHKEQLGKQAVYFNPNDENELQKIMIDFLNETKTKPEFNYNEKLALFGIKFMEVINKLKNN